MQGSTRIRRTIAHGGNDKLLPENTVVIPLRTGKSVRYSLNDNNKVDD